MSAPREALRRVPASWGLWLSAPHSFTPGMYGPPTCFCSRWTRSPAHVCMMGSVGHPTGSVQAYTGNLLSLLLLLPRLLPPTQADLS